MHRKNNTLILPRIFLFLLVVATLQLAATVAEAAKVSRTKGRLVEIEMGSGDDYVKGDKVVFTSNGKKIGRAKITKIKGKKAYAKILKGRAAAGAGVIASGGGGGGVDDDGSPSKGSDGSDNMVVGVILGYDLDSQKVTATSANGALTENISMSGGGFSVKGYADMALADELGVIARFGIETFSVAGTSTNSICNLTTACATDIMYLSGDLLVRYVLSPGTLNPFIAGGLGIYFPLSKETNVLDQTKIASTTIFFAGGGINFKMGNMYIPVYAEYGLFPPSNQVSTNFISVKAGIGWAF